jgi:AP-4 complex subunit sigma-1
VNKQGQTRLARYYNTALSQHERLHLEGEIVRRCLTRSGEQCSFVEHREYKCAYRRYASLFFIVGVDADGDDNELGLLEFIHCVVETLDRRHGNVCELDIMMHLDDLYCILDEMVMNGDVVELNKHIVLQESGKYDPGNVVSGHP